MIKKLEKKLRTFNGPLTSELIRQPGKFGLGQLPAGQLPDTTATSICGYCSTGCSLNVHIKDGEPVNLTPQPDYPVNRGMACPKGWEALTPLVAEDRATTPMLRKDKFDRPKSITWQQAADTFCSKIKSIQKAHGPESAAFISTGQICTEEMAFLGTFAKFGMGMIHGDGNTRQCMATSVAAYKESFGFDAPPYTYKDFEESDTIVLIGSNLCIAHPILWQRILLNRNSPEIIIIDPRKTETAMQATQHVQLKPKSDLILLYGLARRLIERGYTDSNFIDNHTNGFAQFSESLSPFSIDYTSDRTGLSEFELENLVDKIGNGKRVSFWWTMGVNQGHEATRTAQAIINLALLTGNIGRPGTGANSITGQCNAMGSRLYSNTTGLLGGRNYRSADDRKIVSEVLGIEESNIQKEPGWAYDQIVDGIESGHIKALWVVATNGAHSWINQARFRKILKKLDFLVVQDLYTSTETAQYADLLLPAAGWGEKEGTFINSERRFGTVKKTSKAPGQALSDYSIIKLLANAWGSGEWLSRWQTPQAAFQLLKALSKGQPCDISGIDDFEAIDQAGGIQWPLTSTSELKHTERRLFEDGQFYTNDKRANFVWDKVRPCPESPDKQFPYELITGRGSSGQWHTQTRTGKSKVLQKLNPTENYIEINPEDAEYLEIDSGNRVTVKSRRGSCDVICRITPTVAKGQMFMPMHFAETNQLTMDCFDPHSRQPSYKHCAIAVSAT